MGVGKRKIQKKRNVREEVEEVLFDNMKINYELISIMFTLTLKILNTVCININLLYL